MRSILALGLLITLCASADATAVHHTKLRHVVVRPNHGLTFGHAASAWDYAPLGPSVGYHDTPSYDDPSKLPYITY